MVPRNHIFKYPVASTAYTKPPDMSYLCWTSRNFVPRRTDMKLPTQCPQQLVIDRFGMKSVVSGEIPRLIPSGASQSLFFRAFLPAHIKRRDICQSIKLVVI